MAIFLLEIRLKYTCSSFIPLKLSPKMVNTRAKIKKTQNTLKTCFPQASTTATDHQSTKSGALIAAIDDLLIEILSRLPVISILRCKSVSKHWQSILSHNRFTHLYDSFSVSSGLFIRNMYIAFDVEDRSPSPFHSLDFYPDLCGLRIVQSCNGLLLCCSDRGNQRARKYYVFNPTTKQFAIIPSVPGGQDVRKTIRFMGLAFHHTYCAHYTVVCIHRVNPKQEQFQIQVYSSKTGKWKITNESFTAPYYTPFRNGVYWNGAIHWAPSCLNQLYFKLDVEQMQKLPLPSPLPARVESSGGYEDGNLPFYFGESRGHLHLVDTSNHETYLHMNVYEMLSDHSGWFIKYQVALDELPVAYPEMINGYQDPSSPHYYEFEIIDVVRGEIEEDTFMVVKIPTKIIRYNVHDKSFKNIFDLANIYHGRIGYSEVHRYIQTLTSF